MSSPTTNSNNDSPLQDFSNCHSGIIENFNLLLQLAETQIEKPVQKDVSQSAKQLLNFFETVVLEHHAEEEQELFTEVRDSARHLQATGEKAVAMIEQLTAEHRSLEAQWQALEPTLRSLAKGKAVSLDCSAAVKLAQDYLAHAEFEEQQFLPLSATILGERGLSSLGLSLHMRHHQVHIPGYI